MDETALTGTEALRELAANATPGPWFFDSYSRIVSSPRAMGYDDIRFPECEVPAWKARCSDPSPCHGCPFFEQDYRDDPVVARVSAHHGDTATGQRVRDAEYIAAVGPDVVLDLLDQIDHLHAIVQDVRDEGEPVGSYGCSWCGAETGHKPDCAWLKIEAEVDRG